MPSNSKMIDVALVSDHSYSKSIDMESEVLIFQKEYGDISSCNIGTELQSQIAMEIVITQGKNSDNMKAMIFSTSLMEMG